jgi:transcription antitermination factor NusG
MHHHSDNDVHWYVLRAVFNRELKVRDALRRAGFYCYVPMCYRVETVHGRKVRRLLPAITELVFIHSTLSAIKEFKLHSKDTVYWLTTPKDGHREKIIVPDKAMEDFIRLTQQREQEVTYFRPGEISLSKGDRIRIHGGSFDGVEGTLVKIKGKRDKKILVSIPEIIAAAVSIRPEVVELIEKQVSKSGDSSGDCKELYRLTTQMLTSPPHRIDQATEYDILYNEISQLYKTLKSLRGYLRTIEGEMALTLMMAEKILKPSISEETHQRFRNALSVIGEETLLAVRMQYIGGKLLHDETLLNKANNTLSIWKKAGTTSRQKTIIDEISLWMMTE